MTTATGTFEVTGGMDDAYEELDGGIKLTHASGTQTFEGDIEADGAVHWLMLYRPDKSATSSACSASAGRSVGGGARSSWPPRAITRAARRSG